VIFERRWLKWVYHVRDNFFELDFIVIEGPCINLAGKCLTHFFAGFTSAIFEFSYGKNSKGLCKYCTVATKFCYWYWVVIVVAIRSWSHWTMLHIVVLLRWRTDPTSTTKLTQKKGPKLSIFILILSSQNFEMFTSAIRGCLNGGVATSTNRSKFIKKKVSTSLW
jgi:hypothetical protein